MQKQVLYDHQMFEMQQVGGISRYFAELLKLNSQEVSTSLAIRKTSNCYLEADERFAHFVQRTQDHYPKFILPFHFKGKSRLYRTFVKFTRYDQCNTLISTKMLRKGKFDIFHPTYYNPYFLQDLKQKPMVLTVFDMIHERLPQYFSKNDSTSQRKKLLCDRADHIVAISDSTKNDLVEILNVDPDKITVIYLGNSLRDQTTVEQLELPERYILFVGRRDGYKNFDTFFDALVPILKKNNELKLVYTGPPPSEGELRKIKDSGVENQAHHHFASDEDLFQLYKQATCFVFPSLYEGFGLPLLEAFSTGCPVISSNGGSLQEVGGSAALYVDPLNEHDIREKIEHVISSEKTRENLCNLGFERLKSFSWDNCRQEHANLYQSI